MTDDGWESTGHRLSTGSFGLERFCGITEGNAAKQVGSNSGLTKIRKPLSISGFLILVY
jgi:hypothetical protein